jgi:hypothetical protein
MENTPAWMHGITIHPSAYERFTEEEILSGRIAVPLLQNPPATKHTQLDTELLLTCYPRKVFDVCARYETRLKRVERSVMALKRANFKRTGDQRLEGHQRENGWEGIYGFKGIREQIEEVVGPYSDTPWIELRDEDVYDSIYQHIWYLYSRHEDFPYTEEGKLWRRRNGVAKWQPEYAAL